MLTTLVVQNVKTTLGATMSIIAVTLFPPRFVVCRVVVAPPMPMTKLVQANPWLQHLSVALFSWPPPRW